MQQLVPLNCSPNQTITLALTVDGASLTLQVVLRYNGIAKYWAMTILNAQGVLLADSVPLITGNDPACNLLRQLSYLQIGSCFIINQSGQTNPNYPNNTNLGSTMVMIWGDTP
jgi:hypothetical protein